MKNAQLLAAWDKLVQYYRERAKAHADSETSKATAQFYRDLEKRGLRMKEKDDAEFPS